MNALTQQLGIWLIGLLLFSTCHHSTAYQIERAFKTIKQNHCECSFSYPQLIFSDSGPKMKELNQLLEIFGGYNDCLFRCKNNQKKPIVIKGDFQVTLKTKDVLSIEFITQERHDDQLDTIYNALVLNPNKMDKGIMSLYVELGEVIPHLDRSDFLKYVRRYNEEKKAKINLQAYKKGSNHVITWGISEEHLFLYVGGEGEFFGEDKIVIPRDELE